jgi:hypothetical protein
MSCDPLQLAITQRPFQPFDLKLADGRAIAIDHPELIAHQAGHRTAVVVEGDPFEVVDLLLVSLNFREIAQAGGLPRS